MKRLTVLVGVVCILATGVMAANDAFIGDNIDRHVERYNQHADQVPGIIASVVGDERINVEISDGNATITYGVVMDGMEVSRVEEGGLDDQTLNVYTSVDTLEAIAQADSPRDRAVEAFQSDEIRYESVNQGFVGTIKESMFSLIVGLQSLF